MKINLKGLALKASVGIYEHEKLLTTKVIISAEVFIKTTTSFDENAIIDYDTIISKIKETALARHYGYIEDLAYSLQSAIKELNHNIETVNIKVQKCILGNVLSELSVEV